MGWQINEFKSLRACPCNLHNLCPAPNGGIINHQHCAFINWRPGLWYFTHGGTRLASLQVLCREWDAGPRVQLAAMHAAGTFTRLSIRKCMSCRFPGGAVWQPHIHCQAGLQLSGVQRT